MDMCLQRRERERATEWIREPITLKCSISFKVILTKYTTLSLFLCVASQMCINFVLFWIPTEFHFRLICSGKCHSVCICICICVYRRYLCASEFLHTRIFSLHWQPKHLSSNNPSINLRVRKKSKQGKSSKCNKRNRKNEKNHSLHAHNTRTHKQTNTHRCANRININIFKFCFSLPFRRTLSVDWWCRCALLVNLKIEKICADF